MAGHRAVLPLLRGYTKLAGASKGVGGGQEGGGCFGCLLVYREAKAKVLGCFDLCRESAERDWELKAEKYAYS